MNSKQNSRTRKKVWIFLIGIFLVGCIPHGAGTLGSSSEFKTTCDQNSVYEYLDVIVSTEQFSVSRDQLEIASHWENGGFNFLKYWVFRYKNTLYCVTHTKNDNSYSIRGLAKMDSRKWKYAIDFTQKDQRDAQESIESLFLELYCE